MENKCFVNPSSCFSFLSLQRLLGRYLRSQMVSPANLQQTYRDERPGAREA